jgi:glycosyltransferase involved in cell wall biosynthesis
MYVPPPHTAAAPIAEDRPLAPSQGGGGVSRAAERKPRLLLDLSRLLWRSARTVPTGIERVELAYARHLIETASDRLCFAGMTSWGRFGPLSHGNARELIQALTRVWQSGQRADRQNVAAITHRLQFDMLAGGEGGLYAAARTGNAPLVYLLVSHHHLEQPKRIQRLKERTGARFVALVHDLIPLTHPEYARPNHDTRHTARMDTVARLADGIILNSTATKQALQPFLDRAGRAPPAVVAPLAVDPRPAATTAVKTVPAPYFVCIGTIEPRKNHLLLLNIWRKLVSERGTPPNLVIIGQRGWENENVIDMIERCTPIQGLVHEFNKLPDAEMARLLQGAQALLLPSFAEGFGLPLAEALMLGVPAICSDLPALREIGGGVPEFLDPLDGPAWHGTILEYCDQKSARRRAQLERLATWRAPCWDDHFRVVDNLLEEVVAQPAA